MPIQCLSDYVSAVVVDLLCEHFVKFIDTSLCKWFGPCPRRGVITG